MAVPQGVINMEQFVVTLDTVKDYEGVYFNLSLSGNDRLFQFYANSVQEAFNWQIELQYHIEDSKKYVKDKAEATDDEPWRYDTIDELDLLKNADTGDFLLFRTENTGGKITRTFTKSNFDHIAMIIRFESADNEMFYMDCT